MSESAVAQLIIEQGRQAAEARAAQGAIWGRAVDNLSQIPGQVMQQNRQNQELAMRHQALQSELALRGQQFQAGQQAQQDVVTADKLWADPDIYNADRTINRSGVQAKLASANAGHLLPHVMGIADTLDEGTQKIQETNTKLYSQHNEILGQTALKLDAANNDPGAFHLAVSTLSRPDVGVISKAQADQWLQVNTPEQVAAVTKQWKAGTKAGEPHIAMVPEGATPLDERTMAPIPGFAVTPKPPTEAELDDAAQKLYAKKGAGQPLLPQEQANLSAYEQRKRVISDPALIAANERQASTQAQQNAIQARAQTFQEQQAGRKELTEKVEQPYQTALASANTLRETVAAAQAGNKVAGSLQSLETTMAAIRAQGLNRINTAEIGVTADAGNLWDHIVGYVGKKAEGQPVPANIQKDMTDFASILEKAAYKKYQEGHSAVTGRYKLADEKPMPPPSSLAPIATPSKYKVTVE